MEIEDLKYDNVTLKGIAAAARLDRDVMRDRLRKPDQSLQRAVATVVYKWLDHDFTRTMGQSQEAKAGEMIVYFCAGLTEELPALAATPAPATTSSTTGVMPANPTEGTTP